MDGWFFVIRKVAGLYSTGGGDYAHIFSMPKPFRFLRELKGEMQDHLGWRFPVSFYRKVLQPPAVTDAFLLALFFLGGVPIHSPTGLWTKKTANSRTSSRNNM